MPRVAVVLDGVLDLALGPRRSVYVNVPSAATLAEPMSMPSPAVGSSVRQMSTVFPAPKPTGASSFPVRVRSWLRGEEAGARTVTAVATRGWSRTRRERVEVPLVSVTAKIRLPSGDQASPPGTRVVSA